MKRIISLVLVTVLVLTTISAQALSLPTSFSIRNNIRWNDSKETVVEKLKTEQNSSVYTFEEVDAGINYLWVMDVDNASLGNNKASLVKMRFFGTKKVGLFHIMYTTIIGKGEYEDNLAEYKRLTAQLTDKYGKFDTYIDKTKNYKNVKKGDDVLAAQTYMFDGTTIYIHLSHSVETKGRYGITIEYASESSDQLLDSLFDGTYSEDEPVFGL